MTSARGGLGTEFTFKRNTAHNSYEGARMQGGFGAEFPVENTRFETPLISSAWGGRGTLFSVEVGASRYTYEGPWVRGECGT